MKHLLYNTTKPAHLRVVRPIGEIQIIYSINHCMIVSKTELLEGEVQDLCIMPFGNNNGLHNYICTNGFVHEIID